MFFLISIFCLNLCIVIGNPFAHKFQHDIPSQIISNPVFGDLIKVLQNYQKAHNMNAILTDKFFCQRKYVIATYACPHAVGNHMHEFLNSYLAAIVTDRTVLWEFCPRAPCKLDIEDDCNDFLTRFPWILSYTFFLKNWKQRHCNETMKEYNLISRGERHRGEEILMCCGLDQIQEYPILRIGTMEGHELLAFNTTNVRLLSENKQLAQILFHHGEDFLYGILFRTVFAYKSIVIENNQKFVFLQLSKNVNFSSKFSFPNLSLKEDRSSQQSLQQLSSHIWTIGVHLRHASNAADTRHLVDKQGINCVQQVKQDLSLLTSSNASNCIIYLASDRNQSLLYWQEHQEEIGCQIITTDHHLAHPEWNEHGPFTDSIAMHDVELLSHADIFIGSSYQIPKLMNLVSTFSLLIAERRASNEQYQLAKQFRPKWLPDCLPSIAGRLIPKNMFMEPNFTCIKEELPMGCPYYDDSM
jgi:hypothetical protein